MHCTVPTHFQLSSMHCVWVANCTLPVCSLSVGQDTGIVMRAARKNEEVSSLSHPQGYSWHHGHTCTAYSDKQTRQIMTPPPWDPLPLGTKLLVHKKANLVMPTKHPLITTTHS